MTKIPWDALLANCPATSAWNKWEGEQDYYVRGPGTDPNGGVFEGTVSQIGWTDDVIVAHRHASFGGDENGWMVLNIRTLEVRGPLSEEAWRSEPFLRNIVVKPSAEAWHSLPRCRSPRLD